MAKKNTILFLGTQMEMAGAQHVLLSQAEWFQQHGYSVQAVFFYDKQNLLGRWSAEHSFPILSLEAWKRNSFPLINILRTVSGLLRLWALLREVNIIVTFTPHSNLLGLPLAFFRGTPVRIGTHHGYIEGSPRLAEWLHGRLINSRACSKLVCVSEQVRTLAVEREGVASAKIKVIENGIPALNVSFAREDFRKSIGIDPQQRMLLVVGRLVVQKGHAVLLEAIPKMSNKQAVFTFVGEGPLREQLAQRARDLNVEPRVLFLGARTDVSELLSAADVFVQPSLWEGLSIALLEALRAGLPVIATRVEGVVDAVQDEASALLVAPNDPAALAGAIDRLLADEPLRGQLSKAGRQIAEQKYTIDAMCLAYENLIKELQHAAF
jgi:glycosyltransferase involved in cell wall biosynthesis